jgi:hypothetical protein
MPKTNAETLRIPTSHAANQVASGSGFAVSDEARSVEGGDFGAALDGAVAGGSFWIAAATGGGGGDKTRPSTGCGWAAG